MKQYVRESAISAARWAFMLSSAVVLGPLLVGIAGGGGVDGLAEVNPCSISSIESAP